jgi:hypothetical protein
MVTQDPGGLDYLGPTRYVLRRRERFGFWTAIVLFALSAVLLTVATVSVATGYTPVWGVWDVLRFGLGRAGGGIVVLRDRAAVVGQVLLGVGDAGIYLADPPRHLPWAEVAGLVAFRSSPDDDDGEWLSRLVVVRPGEDCLPGAVVRQLSSPDGWGAVVELHDEKLRLRDLAAAVHACAPGLPVWDAGRVESKSVEGQGST